MLNIGVEKKQYYNTDAVIILENIYNDGQNINNVKEYIIKILNNSQKQLKKYCFVKMCFEL